MLHTMMNARLNNCFHSMSHFIIVNSIYVRTENNSVFYSDTYRRELFTQMPNFSLNSVAHATITVSVTVLSA